MLTPADARAIVERLVEQARAAGATAADAMLVGSRSSSVTVRMGALEDVQRSESDDIGLRVFDGSRSASVSSSDLSNEGLAALVERAIAMAREAPEDPFAGLAPAALLLKGEPPAMDGDDPHEPDPAELRARALAAEEAALAVPRTSNSGGSSASASAAAVALATSDGFSGAYRATGHSGSVTVVAGAGSAMQRDYAWHSARFLADVEEPAEIGERAGRRAVARLDPIKISGGVMPVLFDPRVANSLLGHFTAAISGSAIARQASFLLGKLGERVFGTGIRIHDDPLLRRGLRSRSFDGEGLPVRAMDLVADGVLTSWLADSAAARQLGIEPTGHAVRGIGGAPGAGPSNLWLAPGEQSRAQLLASVPRAILVTELIGQGVNGITGDYSRGASGFLVENGEIGPALSELTIASNLVEMFATLVPASDLAHRRGIDSPTLLVPAMTVASA